MPLKEIKTEWYHYYLNDADQYHGEYKGYNKDGQLRAHCHYKNGGRHGEYKRYWDNDQLRVDCHYNNGYVHGEYKSYYDNGKLWCHTYDVNGHEVHDFIKDGDSDLIRTCLYVAHGAPFLT